MKKNSQAFVNQLVICLLLTMTFGGSIGLGTVWIRHQNSLIANANRKLAAKIAEVQRRSDQMTTEMLDEQQPNVLRRLNTTMRLGLVPMTMDEVPIIRVTEDPVQRLVERANRDLFLGADAPVAPITFKLASR